MAENDDTARQEDINKVYACLRKWHTYAIGLHSPILEERSEETIEALEAMRRIVQPRFNWAPRREQ